MDKDWSITLDKFQGFAPGFWGNDFPFDGEKSQARDMSVVDLFYSSGLKQGMGISTMTNGDNTTAVTTLVKSVLDFPPTSNVTYGIGGNLLHKITSTSVVDDATWPYTINKAAVTAEDGEDICYYQGDIYYTFNHSGTAGDIGKYNMDVTFDDDWGSTASDVAGRATLVGGVPHQAIVGGDDKMYICNGRYIASVSANLLTDKALDFLTGSVVSSIAWNNNKLYCAVNKTSLSGNNKILSSIYIWDATSSSWEIEIPINGRLGALFVKDGLTYFWWEELIADNSIFKIGYLDGTIVRELTTYAESSPTQSALPQFYQVTSYKNHIVWSKYENAILTLTYSYIVNDPVATVDSATATIDNYTSTSVMGLLSHGNASTTLEPKFFQCLKPRYLTVGAVANPFGTLMVASKTGSSYDLSIANDYSTACTWKTIWMDLSSGTKKARLRRIVVYTEPILTGGKLDTTLRYDFNKSNLALSQIAYSAGANKTRHRIYDDGVDIENFALDFTWENGSTANPVNIRKVEVEGTFIDDV